MQQLYPAGFNRGFQETFSAYGLLLDRLAMGVVNGFTYHQPQPFDMPGPDGPKDPQWLGAEVGRRAGVAAAAFEGRIWREALQRWDEELKPASERRHRELGSIDLACRAGLAVFASAIMPSVQAMLRMITAPADRGRAFGVQGSVVGVAAGLGPVIGGILLATLGWRAIFGSPLGDPSHLRSRAGAGRARHPDGGNRGCP